MWTCVRSTMFKPRWSNNLPLVCLPTDPGFYQRLIWRTRVKARVLHYSKVTTTCRRNQLHSVLAITIHLSLRDLGSGWSRLVCPLDSQLGFWLEDPRQAARSTKPPVLDSSRFIGQPAFRTTVISEPCATFCCFGRPANRQLQSKTLAQLDRGGSVGSFHLISCRGSSVGPRAGLPAFLFPVRDITCFAYPSFLLGCLKKQNMGKLLVEGSSRSLHGSVSGRLSPLVRSARTDEMASTEPRPGAVRLAPSRRSRGGVFGGAWVWLKGKTKGLIRHVRIPKNR